MPATPTTAILVLPSPAPRERDGAQRQGEGQSTSPDPRRPRLPGRRLARDIIRCLTRTFGPLDPRELLAPAQIAEVDRLLRRGGRFFAPPSEVRPAKPFPVTGAVTARQAVHALFRLLVRIDPRILDTMPP